MNEDQNKELYKRVENAAKFFAGNIRAFTALLGFNYRTFYGYLNIARQHNLWSLLPEILAAYPRLSRQWLYFGEGPMLIGMGIPLDEPVPLQAITKAAEAMAADCGGSWGNVLRMVVGRVHDEATGRDIQEENGCKGDTGQDGDIASAKDEIARLQKKLEDCQTKLVAAQEELLSIHKSKNASAAEKTHSCNAMGRPVPTGGTAAPL